MPKFPRTTVGGISLPRMIIGTNWFLGFSHCSSAKSKLITDMHCSKESIADVLEVFLQYDINAVMSSPNEHMRDAIHLAQDRSGKEITWIMSPRFQIRPEETEYEIEKICAHCKSLGATICMPHQCVTDALVDRRDHKIRDIDPITKAIREHEMIPALSTHMPETVRIADNIGVDVETYIQIYNSAGFLMQVEVDWVKRIIQNAKKPVMTIKPLAAGRLTPPVGLAFAWNTIRDQDMVTVGTTSPDEAKEVIEISLDYLERRLPQHKLQTTRSKSSLVE